jgi:epoxyqueuosine reductase
MLTKKEILDKALSLGFADAGITTAESFETQRELLENKREEYAWAKAMGLDLELGTDPRKVYADARSIIVVLEAYYTRSYPPDMEGHFGRCYLDDDRVTRDGLALRIKDFRQFLRDHGIESKVPFHVPHRLAAARAGLGTFGKNCLFYASGAARNSSWVLPVAFLVNSELEPDSPTMENGCPDWCRNACVAACPTRALKGDGTINPGRCISYLSYYGRGLTPRELREPMGVCVYGCDRCQNVCPRNIPWMSQDLPRHEKVAARAGDFSLPKLLHMNREYFQARVWPHMFYMSPDDIWRWKMNAARAMGNSLDTSYAADLEKAFREFDDDRVRSMAAWALGRIGGSEARSFLEGMRRDAAGPVLEEVQMALDGCGR